MVSDWSTVVPWLPPVMAIDGAMVPGYVLGGSVGPERRPKDFIPTKVHKPLAVVDGSILLDFAIPPGLEIFDLWFFGEDAGRAPLRGLMRGLSGQNRAFQPVPTEHPGRVCFSLDLLPGERYASISVFLVRSCDVAALGGVLEAGLSEHRADDGFFNWNVALVPASAEVARPSQPVRCDQPGSDGPPAGVVGGGVLWDVF